MSLKKWIVAATLVILINGVIFVLHPSFFPAESNQNPNGKIVQNKLGNESTENTAIKTIDSPYVKEYSLPNGTFPNGILVDDNGMVWIAGSTSTLFKFDPNVGTMESYQISEKSSTNNQSKKSLMVWSIMQDNDGLIWFSQMGPDPLWQFNPETKRFTAFHSSASPFQMKVDKMGDIWFTTLTANTVGVIQKTDLPEHYKISEFDVGNTYPSGIFLKENYLWITQIQSQKLAKFETIRNKEGTVTNISKTLELPNDNRTSIFSPTDIIDSGDLWITEHGTSFLTRYETNNQLQRFPTTPSPQNSTTLPFWLRQDPNTHGIWFNEHTGNRIAFFDTANISMTEYEIPSRPSDGYVVYPLNIAMDPNSNKIWFSGWNTDKFGMIDTKIPIPFDIKTNSNQIIISNENNVNTLSFEIIKNEPLRNNVTLSFKLSSSMDPTSKLVNMTAKFSKENVNLSSIQKTEKVILDLQSHDAKAGNYTLGISATDGMVTKSAFVDLIIK